MVQPSNSDTNLPRRILEEVSRVVLGKEEAKRLLLVALLSGGHLLIEGLPGTAKTLLARSFAQAIGGEFRRAQFTPDTLPADITGFYLYTTQGASRFVPGPVHANVLLADELNRTTPRTQSALLEAMQEGQATVEGHTHPLPQPFIVIATQVPYGREGTYPLTEVQVDRFMLRAWSPYPDREEEAGVLEGIDRLEAPDIKAVTTPEEVVRVRKEVQGVHVAPAVRDYILAIVSHVREDPDVLIGPSPRASISMYKGARALAYLDGRNFAIPDDVKPLAVPTVVHRARVKVEAEMDGVTPEVVVQRALERTPVPTVPV